MSVAFRPPGSGPAGVSRTGGAPPVLDKARIAHVLRRLKGRHVRLALRWRIAPVTRKGGFVFCVVTDKAGARLARGMGWIVAWRAGRDDFLAALQEVYGRAIAQRAAFGLARSRPRLSAMRRMDGRQTVIFTLLALAAAALLFAAPGILRATGMIILPVLFLSLAALRLAALRPAPRRRPAKRLKDAQLPVYTVLVPLYREVPVLEQLIGALSMLDYPADKLDIKLIAEACDKPVRAALAAMTLPEYFEVIIAPPAGPRTKPRALNYALAFARGDLVTIYDAEDIPDPGQLRAAAARFAAEGDDLACLQARLAWYNPNENWLTRMFAIEYASHFDVVLPMLAEMGLPLPLGGTSNHFRRAALEQAGGWDAHNVTEDADLGMRLARLGWRTGVLASTTWEEACRTFAAWRAQRARWVKGWLQTWLVHMRQPMRLVRETGMGGMFILQAMMGAGVFATLAHPFFLLAAMWGALAPAHQLSLGAAIQASVSAVVLAAGYGAAMMAGALGLYRRGMLKLWPCLLTMPLYWLLLSVAGWLAVWDFIIRPHHWRKTEHGLSAFQRGE